MPRTKIVFEDEAFREIMTGPAEAIVAEKTAAIAAECNGQSSWGGYDSDVNVSAIRARGTVWSYARQDGKGMTVRAQRLIANLDA